MDDIQQNYQIRLSEEQIERTQIYNRYHEHRKEIFNETDIDKNHENINIIKSELENSLWGTHKDEKGMIYPDYQNEDFINEISRNMEFKYYKNKLDISEIEKKCEDKFDDFELDNHQKFLGNFMNNNTPYKGLLIFHGVGTGKTCSAITISNNFRTLNSKIIVVVSDTIKPGWFKNIYNENLGTEQCSGDSIHKMLDINDDELYQNSDQLKGKIKKKINEYYEFSGYQKFSNDTKKLVSQKINEEYNRINISEAQDILTFVSDDNKNVENEIMKKYNITRDDIIKIEMDVIKKKYSNRLMIVDEIHNLREEKTTNSSLQSERDSIKYFKKIIKHSDNLRLILMSATPLYNKSTEIISLINLLLLNDGRPLLKDEDVFDNHDNVTEEGKKILINKTRGYISYLRGENPISFPIRLYPKDDNVENTNYKLQEDGTYKIIKIKLDIRGNSIQKKDRIQFLNLYYNKLVNDGEQHKIYSQFISGIGPGELDLNDISKGIQILNITFPGSTSIDNSYGGRGLERLMDIKLSGSKNFKFKEKALNDYGNIFDKKNIGKYSSKFKNILEKIENGDGIIFIYSEYLTGCIYPFGIFLEQNGYSNYNGNIFTAPKNVQKKDEKYVILDGSMSKSQIAKNIDIINDDTNKNGQTIKIILGSAVTSEGLDFRAIRQIHIMEPWFHLFKIEQIIGRGIRRCSHYSLPEEQRNVTVYHHVSKNEIRNKYRELVDVYLYRKAENKAISVGNVESILKDNAIDNYLNEDVNHIRKRNVFKKDLITSAGNKLENYDISDKPYSKICSFMKKCKIQKHVYDNIITDINYNTFEFSDKQKHVFKNVIKYIRYIYEINLSYTLNEIVELLLTDKDLKENDLGLGIDLKNNKLVIFYTLNKMIHEKISIWYNNISGYILFTNNRYTFQPYLNTNKNINICDRINDYKPKDPDEYIDVIYDHHAKIKFKLIKLSEIIRNIKSNRQLILTKINNNPIISEIKDNIIIEYCLDNLMINEKISLLQHLTVKIIEGDEEKFSEDEKLYRKLLSNFIYKINEDTYSIKKHKKKKCEGFFICNKKTTNNDDYIDIYLYDINTKTFINDNHIKNSNIIDSLGANRAEIDGILLNDKPLKYWGYSYKEGGDDDDIYNNVTKYISDHLGSTNGTILDNIPQKITLISKVNYHGLLSDFYSEIFKKDEEVKQLYKNIKSENILKIWNNSNLRTVFADNSIVKILTVIEGNEDFNSFLTILTNIYINDVFLDNYKPVICLIINLLLRTQKIFISYDLHLFKFEKYQYNI